MSTEKIEPTVNLISGLPGELLRQAREDKGLTIEEMSAISNLTKQVIRGIESDEYSGLAGLSFVRGYLGSTLKSWVLMKLWYSKLLIGGRPNK